MGVIDEMIDEEEQTEDEIHRHYIKLELMQAKQELGDLHKIILELESQAICAARQFNRGAIHRDGERFMNYAFATRWGPTIRTHVQQ